MAEVIPESLSNSDSATAGEKRVFNFLRDILLPDEEYIVWHEPRMMQRYPDFIIWSQTHGLLLVEVKDWLASQIRKMNPDNFELDFGDGIRKFKSPLAQVREAANHAMSTLKKVPSLKHSRGTNKDKLIFPVGYAVFWTNITSSQAEEIKLPDVIPGELCFYQDDLRLDPSSRDHQRAISARMKKAFTTWYDFDPLSTENLNLLRHAIFPEVRIQSVRKLRSAGDEDILKTLDLQQEKTAKSIGNGHRIIQGVAGSGKTLVLSCRARYLKSASVKWRVLIVCYNISLSRYICQLIRAAGANGSSADIEVIHFHGLVKKLTGLNLSKQEGEDSETYDERMGQILLGRIAEGTIPGGCYDAILIDEGQDFQETWMKGLLQLLNNKTDSLLFCYDPAQNVFGRKRPNWKQVGMKVQGKKPVRLQTNYRNTPQILKAANIFGDAPVAAAEGGQDDDLHQQLIPVPVDRHGTAPVLTRRHSCAAICSYILDTMDEYTRSEECSWSDIGVLYVNRKWMGFPASFTDAFEKRFGANRLYWATKDRKSKIELDLTTPSAKLLTIESCKGMEFRVVFLVGLDGMPRSYISPDIERKLAYVGITRAQDMLHVVYLSETGFINEIKQGLAAGAN